MARRLSSVSRNWALRGLFVNSLTGKWSAGVRTSAASSTYLNQRLVARVAPAIKYNIFPMPNRPGAGGPSNTPPDRGTPSILNRRSTTRPETLWDHSLSAELDLKQPWGTWNSSVDMQQYYYDLSKYRVGFDNEFDVRLFRGLSLNLNSNAQIIRNQIYLAAGGATPRDPRAPAATRHVVQLLRLLRHQLHLQLNLQQRRQSPVRRMTGIRNSEFGVRN